MEGAFEMVKKIISNDKKNKKEEIFMRVISVVVAIGLWLFVVYSENPVREVWVRNIPIAYKNFEVLENNSLVIIESNTKNSSVKVNGRRRDVLMLSNNTVSASVDISNIKEPGQYNLPVSFSFPIDSVDITDKSPYNITLTVDKLIKTTKEIQVNYIGSPAEGCHYEDAILSSASALISGPSSLLSSVSSVSVDVDISGISENMETTAVPKIIFKEGFEENAQYIKCETSSVKVLVPVGVSKVVPIKVDYASTLVFEPSTAEITGPAEIISSIESITTLPVVFPEGENSAVAELVLPEGVVANISSVTVSLPEPPLTPDEENTEQ